MSKVIKRFPENSIKNLAKADGMYVIDSVGNTFLDMASGSMIANLGYNNKEIINVINSKYKNMSYCHNGNYSHESQELLAEKLNDLFDEEYHSYFCSSGSEVIEAALRISYAYQCINGKSNNDKFVAFNESYHGSSLGALSITGAPKARNYWKDLVKKNVFIGRNEEFEYLENIFSENVAGFVVEPLSTNATGVIEYPKTTLEDIYKITRKNNQLIIFDEISTSIGRTGSNFYFEQQNLNFSPDIICCSKGLGVGYFNIGVVLVKKDISDKIMNSHIPLLGHSYNGHPIGTAVGVKVLEIIERESYVEKNIKIAKTLNSGIERVISNYDGIKLHHKSLVSSIHLSDEFDKFTSRELYETLLKNKVMTVPSSKKHITISPPFILTNNQIDEFLDKLEKSIAEIIRK